VVERVPITLLRSHKSRHSRFFERLLEQSLVELGYRQQIVEEKFLDPDKPVVRAHVAGEGAQSDGGNEPMTKKALVVTNVRLPADLLYELRSLAIEEGVGMPTLIRQVMARYHSVKPPNKEARRL